MMTTDQLTNKLFCGDCVEIMKKFPDECIDLILTDPPYGINYQSARRIDKLQWKPKIANDKTPFVVWIQDALRILKDNGCILCFYRWDVQDSFINEFKKFGGIIKSQIIWDKQIHGMGDLKSSFAPQHECILFVTKGKFNFPNKRPHSIIYEKRVNANKLIHPNEKPIKLMKNLINHCSEKNDLTLDCFAGSGTALVACKQLNRNWCGIEISPEYCKIIKQRLQDKK